jgi:hypothetical protein
MLAAAVPCAEVVCFLSARQMRAVSVFTFYFWRRHTWHGTTNNLPLLSTSFARLKIYSRFVK